MKKYLPQAFVISLFLIALIVGTHKVEAQSACPAGSECSWVNVDDVTRFGVKPSVSSQHFWFDDRHTGSDQVTRNQLCLASGYESNSAGDSNVKVSKWSKCNAEYHVDWRSGGWNSHSCGGDYYLTSVYCARTIPPAPEPTVTISANPQAVKPFNTTEITWSSQNTTSCTASGDWSGTKGTSGTEESPMFIIGGKTFTLTCTGPGGVASDVVNVSLFVIPSAPTISWTKQPDNVMSGASYTIEAKGEDTDGDLKAVTIKKSAQQFTSADGGDGYSSLASGQSSENGPNQVTYTAQATDARGVQSAEISHTVHILSLQTNTTTTGTGPGVTIVGTFDGTTVPVTTGPTVSLTPITATAAATPSCVAPGGSISVTGSASGGILNGSTSIITSNNLEKDGNKDGIYGVIASRSDAGSNSATITVPASETSNRYDFRTVVNGSVYSPIASVTIDASCGAQSNICTIFPSLCGPVNPPVVPVSPSVSLSASPTCSLPGGTVTFRSTAGGSVTSHSIEKDSNQDGIYGGFASLSGGAGTQTYSSSLTEGVYDFRSVVNGSIYSSPVRVTVSSSCMPPVVPPSNPGVTTGGGTGGICTLQAVPAVRSSGTKPPGVSFKSVSPPPQSGVPSTIFWFAPTTVINSNGDSEPVSCSGGSNDGPWINGNTSVTPSNGTSVTATTCSSSQGSSELSVSFRCAAPVVPTCSDSKAANSGQPGTCIYPNFTLTASPSTVKVKSISGYSGATQEVINLSVNPSYFTVPVSIDVKSVTEGLNPEFSFNGGAYSSSRQAPFTLNSGGLQFLPIRIRFTGKLPTTNSAAITFRGVGVDSHAGTITQEATINLDLRPAYPDWREE